ncbi:LysR family transcriptional regulator [Verminephrobacter eiseniae]|uniref:Transcriptional regulator, LysR family n=1 Tax=Verminephrobacter eiseniae (strain EF01-2) TaxID=391735 RepID=A1WLY0_VEREI|nr:LysR family transcriptional regulator [Verminephrobacter eiseniae]ABM58637.1 transcriptional regulator, LysR family [Verminephrobacter eiseniae EF01-2]MCW5284208.1 LysR family transcriptional regulator [Verminephrobacter eiseniae]MCW5301915.1 LysR family transcriptional regulator [Verminephrobacter eiseniae]MCW8178896.1 LysR family transcriptional regulator [Verminephrobacter eiseniae]MCW8191379.1 LysR family transcriptional regulator [Verminephrobacter eiseniae]
MNITFKQLEAFVYSAKLRSFSSAAAKLRATQSAISKRVAELEQEFGVPLLHRTAQGLEMAQAGRRLLPLAEESQRLWARIDHEMGGDQTLRGTFRVGVTELIAMTWLTRFIQRLRQLHPEMSIEPVVDAGLLLFAGLEANKIDIAIMPGTHWGKSYETVKVGQVEDLWVASPSLKIPDRVLKPHEFGLYPVLEQSSGAAKNRYYEAWRAEHKFQFGKLFQTNSTTVLRQLTINGFGISQLALDYVRPDIEAGLLRIVKSDPMPPPMIYGAVYRNDNPGPAVQRIVELAVQMCDFSAGGNPRRAAGNAPPDERRPARRPARPARRP